MQSRSYVADERALTSLAASQSGYFTSKQAAAIGYTAPKRNYHGYVGNWLRERCGNLSILNAATASAPRSDSMEASRGIDRDQTQAFKDSVIAFPS